MRMEINPVKAEDIYQKEHLSIQMHANTINFASNVETDEKTQSDLEEDELESENYAQMHCDGMTKQDKTNCRLIRKFFFQFRIGLEFLEEQKATTPFRNF